MNECKLCTVLDKVKDGTARYDDINSIKLDDYQFITCEHRNPVKWRKNHPHSNPPLDKPLMISGGLNSHCPDIDICKAKLWADRGQPRHERIYWYAIYKYVMDENNDEYDEYPREEYRNYEVEEWAEIPERINNE